MDSLGRQELLALRILKFFYRRYPASPPGIRPARFTYRPVIDVTLSTKKEQVEFSALIDSGADQCTFPGWVAEELGFKVEKGERRLFSGIGGSVLAYRHKTNIVVGKRHFLTDVFYSHQWDDMPFGLLGQEGFFSRFAIYFDHEKKLIHLS
ncbi:MAG: retropepsin-like domain-containing protein [Elusimicrobia bacterium]|nr:retropepsin-like domain-containing protein [Candidatus Obscuribacterium magneticum]